MATSTTSLTKVQNPDTESFVFDISSQEGLHSLKEQAFQLIDSEERDVALNMSRSLEKFLGNIQTNNAEEAQNLDIAIFWMLKLHLFCFRKLTLTEQLDFIKKYTLLCLIDGLDIQKAIFDFIDLFDSGSTVTNFTNQYLSALNSVKINFGDPSKFTNGFKPTLQNWLGEYQTSINKRGTNSDPAFFDILTFIDTNSNVKFLTEFQQEILKELLSLYNFLLTPVAYRNVTPKKQFSRVTEEVVAKRPTQSISKPPVMDSLLKVPKDLPTMQMPRTLGASSGVNVQRTLYTQNQNEPAGLRMEDLNLEQSPAAQLPKSPLPVPKKAINNFPAQEDKAKVIEQRLAELKKKVGKKE